VTNLFSNYFSTINSPLSKPLTSPNLIPSYSFLPSSVKFTIDDVSQFLSSLRNIKSIGPDGIQGHFLYILRDVIAWPIYLLCKKSFDSGTFPSSLKLGSIIPILKSGNQALVTNYRPITTLSHLSKLFETIVLNSIRPSLNNILCEEQHGFRPGHSTITCNLILSSYVFDSFRQQSQVDVIYTDFSKAFDRVNHRLLIQTLDCLGIGEPLLSWLRSYLSDRPYFVSASGFTSNTFYTCSGVPQGAVLSPLLFALFVNSAPSILHHSKLLIFADDMKLFLKIKSPSDCNLLQADLQRLIEWSDSLGLPLNISKCSIMSFFRRSSPYIFPYFISNTSLNRVDSIRDLGFIFTHNFSPNKHIESISCKSLKLLGFISRITQEFHLSSSFMSLYCSLVRPTLEYGSVLWDPQTACASATIERVQRKFLRLAAFRLNIAHPPHDYSPILQTLHLSSLADRRHISNLSFLSKLFSNKIDSHELISFLNFKILIRSTRSTIPFLIPPSATFFLDSSPILRLMRAANNDPSFTIKP
jgi:Reverse transcriptase (RNA-dependent DNA polymerase)